MDKINDHEIVVDDNCNTLNLSAIKSQYRTLRNFLLINFIICFGLIALGTKFIYNNFDRGMDWLNAEHVPITFVANLGRDPEDTKRFIVKYKRPDGKEIVLSSPVKIYQKSRRGEPVYCYESNGKVFIEEFFLGMAVLGVILILISLSWLIIQTLPVYNKFKTLITIMISPRSFDVVKGEIGEVGFNYKRKLILSPKARQYYEDSDDIPETDENGEYNVTSDYVMGEEHRTRISYSYIFNKNSYMGYSPLMNYDFAKKYEEVKNVWVAVKRNNPKVNHFVGFVEIGQ